ncbi:hypothetical protein IFM89_001834 [Coptis chinensis]|uniref:F-box domain-containing protein n=1 Tax=Coptis chinensis TaxID=261450 RepID=A0A835LLD3_9MAGN|nr:hypothetical protein IFM89_001834 [Coptis chinensis]
MVSGDSGTIQVPNQCGSSLFLALPDDVFAFVTCTLAPKDVCNLGLCCKNLSALTGSVKVWLVQCESVGVVGSLELVEWRKGVSSYKSLCKFLCSVKPLIGIWVHQNPELGNVVYVLPGFVSVVGCRIIPQELGPLGIEDGPILWAPVFEIIGDTDGSMAFFLHGRERDCDHLYPGSLKAIDKNCNVLLLEVEPKQINCGGTLLHSKSLVHCNSDRELSKRICKSDRGSSGSQRVLEKNSIVPFCNLGFGDRRKLLELVADHVRLRAPNLANGLLFPPLRDDDESFRNDIMLMSKRRSLLMKIYKFGEGCTNLLEAHRLPSNPTQMELNKIKKMLDHPSSFCGSVNRDVGQICSPKKRTVASYFKDRLKLILGRSTSVNGSRDGSRNGTSSTSSENKHSQFQEFLRPADSIGMTLCAKYVKLLTYRAWPNMHDNHFALYKLPTPRPITGQEYAGLWGGTFGWPPGKPSDDKPGKALFFLSLSYEESEGQKLLIATKILEGTHYVLHPNGSAMFLVKVDELSSDPFPWNNDGASRSVDVKRAYSGEGIANGYGFRYPGSKPGSLYVIQDGLLAFVWKESRAVLTLQRLNLQDLLKKGERVLALPPIVNFAYLTKSYSNVFTGFSNTTRGRGRPPAVNTRLHRVEEALQGSKMELREIKEMLSQLRALIIDAYATVEEQLRAKG